MISNLRALLTRRFRTLSHGGLNECYETFLEIKNGLPHLSLPLPSKKENTVFVLKPFSQNFGHLIQSIKEEDLGLERVAFKTLEGLRMSSSTPLESLLSTEFDLLLNDETIRIYPPKDKLSLSEPEKYLSDVMIRVSQLYGALHVKEFVVQRERTLRLQIEESKMELALLEPIYNQISKEASLSTEIRLLGILCIPCFQIGLFFELTFNIYSWDILEPITYFVTALNGIISFIYFLLVRSEYTSSNILSREWLKQFHKKALKFNFDFLRYNQLIDDIRQKEEKYSRCLELYQNSETSTSSSSL